MHLVRFVVQVLWLEEPLQSVDQCGDQVHGAWKELVGASSKILVQACCLLLRAAGGERLVEACTAQKQGLPAITVCAF